MAFVCVCLCAPETSIFPSVVLQTYMCSCNELYWLSVAQLDGYYVMAKNIIMIIVTLFW